MFALALPVRGCVAAAIPSGLRASHTHTRISMWPSHTDSQVGRSLSHLMAPKTKTVVSGCFAEVHSGLASLNVSALGVIFRAMPVPVLYNISCVFAARGVRRLSFSSCYCCGPKSLCAGPMRHTLIE